MPTFVVITALMATGVWVLFLTGPRRGNAQSVEVIFAAIAVASVIFFVPVVIRSHNMAGGLGLAVAAFVFTFATLLGAYAGLDLQAVTNSGSACLVGPNGVDIGATGAAHIDKLDALYFAVTTLSTVGFGDIVAHSDTCRRLVIGEIVLGFPALGVAVAGVAARIFAKARDPTRDANAARTAAKAAETAARAAEVAAEASDIVASAAAAVGANAPAEPARPAKAAGRATSKSRGLGPSAAPDGD